MIKYGQLIAFMRFKSPLFYLYQQAFKHAKDFQKKFLLSQLLLICSRLVDVLDPLILAFILNEIQKNQQLVISDLVPYFLILFALIPIFWLFHFPARVLERNCAYQIQKNYQLHLFYILRLLPLKWHKNHHSGALMSRVETASNALYNFCDSTFQKLEMIVFFVFSLVTLFVLSPGLTAFLIIATFSTYVIVNKFDKVIIKLLHLTNEKRHTASSKFYDFIGNIGTVITLRLGKLAQKNVAQLLSDIEKPYKKESTINELKWLVFTTILNCISLVAIFIYALINIKNSTLMIGTFVALFQYVRTFEDAMYNFGWQYFGILTQATDMKAVEPIFQEYYKLNLKKVRGRVKSDFKNIKIDDLQFKYEDEKLKAHTLKDIQLEFKKGSKIAFVGPSGSGKSTLLKILRGLDEPQSVAVNADGKTFKHIHCLSEVTSLIPQEPEIFESTILYNLTFGLKYSDKDIAKAISQANFKEVIEKLPNGLNTHINEKGVNLSGGQKQRLAVARGLLAASASQILLLDEPTSSLDVQNEIEIYNNIFKEFRKKCVVSVLHKLNLLHLFDYVYIFDDGQIISHGTPDQVSKTPYMQKMLKTYNT